MTSVGNMISVKHTFINLELTEAPFRHRRQKSEPLSFKPLELDPAEKIEYDCFEIEPLPTIEHNIHSGMRMGCGASTPESELELMTNNDVDTLLEPVVFFSSRSSSFDCDDASNIPMMMPIAVMPYYIMANTARTPLNPKAKMFTPFGSIQQEDASTDAAWDSLFFKVDQINLTPTHPNFEEHPGQFEEVGYTSCDLITDFAQLSSQIKTIRETSFSQDSANESTSSGTDPEEFAQEIPSCTTSDSEVVQASLEERDTNSNLSECHRDEHRETCKIEHDEAGEKQRTEMLPTDTVQDSIDLAHAFSGHADECQPVTDLTFEEDMSNLSCAYTDQLLLRKNAPETCVSQRVTKSVLYTGQPAATGVLRSETSCDTADVRTLVRRSKAKACPLPAKLAKHTTNAKTRKAKGRQAQKEKLDSDFDFDTCKPRVNQRVRLMLWMKFLSFSAFLFLVDFACDSRGGFLHAGMRVLSLVSSNDVRPSHLGPTRGELKPQTRTCTCQDEHGWKDADGEGCWVYRVFIANGVISRRDACSPEVMLGNDGIKEHCKRTCRTCTCDGDADDDMDELAEPTHESLLALHNLALVHPESVSFNVEKRLINFASKVANDQGYAV